MYHTLLIIHILFGADALLSGLVAIVSSKGKKVHNTAGKVYYIGMYGVAVSAIIMSLLKFNPFLLAIAVFSFYLTYGGKKAIDNWRMKEAYIPTLKHKLPIYCALITAAFMIVLPVAQMIAGSPSYPILAIFGGILLSFAIRDMRLYSDPANFRPKNKQWLLLHIGKMGGAYIATVTAFLVNNVTMQRGWILWIAPTVAGTVLITAASIKWSKKLKIGKFAPAGNAI